MMGGKQLNRPIPPRQGLNFHFIDELLAITVTNIYRSEQVNRHCLRADWDNLRPLPEPFKDSKKFYLLFQDELDELHGWLPFLFMHVAQVKCQFNPIRYQAASKLNFHRDSDFAAYESAMNKLEANAPPGAQ
jgi:hypothetical protein